MNLQNSEFIFFICANFLSDEIKVSIKILPYHTEKMDSRIHLGIFFEDSKPKNRILQLLDIAIWSMDFSRLTTGVSNLELREFATITA